MSESREIGIIRYVKSDDYKLIHATGFWGGVHSSGELHFEIYQDTIPVPSEIRVIQDENGIREVAIEQNGVKRIVHVGVTMPMSVVPGLIKWLQDKLDAYENEIKRQQK